MTASPDDSSQLRPPLQSSTSLGEGWFGFYSSLALTNATDKLLAIGALAEYVMAARQGESYLAGPWSRSLHADLLWRSTSPGPGRPDDRIAPTWSWASVRSAARFEIAIEGPVTAVLADVVDASCSYTDNNPFELAERGRLALRSCVVPCELRKTVRRRRKTEYFIDHPNLGLNIQVYRDSEKDGSTTTTASGRARAHVQSGDETRVSVRLLHVAETCQYPVTLCIALQSTTSDDGVLQRWGYVESPPLKFHKLHDRDTFNR